MIHIKTIPCGLLGENCYHVYRDGAKKSLLIDPGDGLDEILDAISESGMTPGAVLLTHGHFDHMLATASVAERFSCPVYVHREDEKLLASSALACYDSTFSRLPFHPVNPEHPFDMPGRNLSLNVCGYAFTVCHTPGHTAGSVCYRMDEENILFTGDTLFAQGYGRTDLPSGNMNDMIASLRFLLTLPGHLSVYPGHGPSCTLGEARSFLC